MDDERTPEQIATDIRDTVTALNRLLKEAAGRSLKVDLEAHRVHHMDVKEEGATIVVLGVYQRIEPTPLPVEPPPRKRGHHS